MALVVVVASLVSVPVPASAQRGELYRPPVAAEVIDPFRPPDQPWLAGNRGLEYDTAWGVAVGAIGSGLVVFAGPVAGHLYVTVLHGDGIRSSYSYLSVLTVAVGDRVVGSQIVGYTSDVPFHLGARFAGEYIDPASLFGTEVGAASVFLVPTRGAPPIAGARSPIQGETSGDANRSSSGSESETFGTSAGQAVAGAGLTIAAGAEAVLASL